MSMLRMSCPAASAVNMPACGAGRNTMYIMAAVDAALTAPKSKGRPTAVSACPMTVWFELVAAGINDGYGQLQQFPRGGDHLQRHADTAPEQHITPE